MCITHMHKCNVYGVQVRAKKSNVPFVADCRLQHKCASDVDGSPQVYINIYIYIYINGVYMYAHIYIAREHICIRVYIYLNIVYIDFYICIYNICKHTYVHMCI